MMAPALPEIAKKYGMGVATILWLHKAYVLWRPDITSNVILPMTLSVFFLSFALGPLLYGLLSEHYGRRWVNLALNRLALGH